MRWSADRGAHRRISRLLVALSFRYFAQEHVDIAVVEVGIGGSLDGTNVLSPLVSVLTNVSLDHTDVLGDTVEQIARDKAGSSRRACLSSRLPTIPTRSNHPRRGPTDALTIAPRSGIDGHESRPSEVAYSQSF